MLTREELENFVPPHHRRLTADGVGARSPFLLRSIRVTGDGTNNGQVVIHDGLDTGGRILDTIRISANATTTVTYDDGLEVTNGVYVDLTNVDQVVIIGYNLKP